MSVTLEARTGNRDRNFGSSKGPDARKPAPTPPYQVIRRNGSVTPLDASKITVTLTKAFLAVEGGRAAASRRVHEVVEELTQQIVTALTRRGEAGRTFHIEEIQDQVELALMRGEHHKVARAYVLYREARANERATGARAHETDTPAATLRVKQPDGSPLPLDNARLTRIIEEACEGLSDVDAKPILTETNRNLYDGITTEELALAPIMAARTLIEQEPNYA
jgi:ribonucleoside-diphosphate reductase alpha chain